MNNNILLSFLELSNSEFEFAIYRKSSDNTSKSNGMFRYNLPTSTRADRDTYDVSFKEIDETTKFIAKSTDNINMTKKWLMGVLLEKAIATFNKSEFYVGNHFVPNISFVISSHKEGQCLIQLVPYYLEINNSFGFLADYKFKPFRGYEKTRQEKILSLSLSPDGNKNKNYYSDKMRYLKNFIDNIVPRLFPLKANELTLDIKRTLLELSPFQLNEKTYIFQNGESKIQFQGIKEYKPLNNNIGLPHYVFVFEKSKINISRQLVKALRGQLYPTFSGMENMFGVDFSNDKISSIIVEDYSFDNLKKIPEQLDDIIKRNPNANIVGIFAGIEKDFDTGRNYSPYYTIKSYFLEHEHTIDKEEAKELVKTWMEDGTIDKWMADPQMIAAEETISAKLEEGEIASPPNPATEVMRQIKNGATPEQAAEAIVGITNTVTTTEEHTVTYEEAQELMEHFEKKGYITSSGKMKDTMKNALKTGTLSLPEKYEAARERFEQIIVNADRKPPIRDASRDVVVRINKQVMLSPEFMELWNKIKQKTAYRVHIDTDRLIENCVKAFEEMPKITKTRLVSQTADIHIEKAGIYHTEREMRTTDIENSYQALPDIITAISDETLLTPATVKEILVRSGRCGEFLNNPEAFLEKATEIIRDNRHALAIDGIRYIKLDGQEYYAQEIFDTAELIANLDRNAVKVEHSVYDYVVYDSSSVEKPFAVALDNDPDVKMFFKIPDRFKVETPIGTYNPDWAVYFVKNGEEKLYFILETKGSTSFMDLRTREQLKIHCGKKHFEALDNDIEMKVATNWSQVKEEI